jgi:hypothetical protein
MYSKIQLIAAGTDAAIPTVTGRAALIFVWFMRLFFMSSFAVLRPKLATRHIIIDIVQIALISRMNVLEDDARVSPMKSERISAAAT